MAEAVQFNAERSISELEQLERVGLFTRIEIRRILKRRNAFEYKIVKVNKTKFNYLNYIQYEIGVLKLIKKRRESIGYNQKKKEIDNMIAQKINDLFKACIKRYPGDVKLWITHREFLKKMNWLENMSSMLNKMLQMHNKSPELWVSVAKWEWEDSGSTETSRKILQRAIRFHDDSPLLWREYFRMELLYVEELQQRLSILGSNHPDEANDAILEGKIPVIIFQNAVKKIKDVDFALSFLPICKRFDFTAKHEAIIYDHIAKNHRNSELVWNLLAMKCLEKSPPHGKKGIQQIEEEAFITFEDGVQTVQTTRMWDFYLYSVLERLGATTSPKRGRHLIQKFLKLAERAFQSNLLSKEMHIEWVKLLHSKDPFSLETQNMAKAGTERWPKDCNIWALRFSLDANLLPPEEFIKCFYQAVEVVPDKESLPLWRFGIEWATCGTSDYLQDICEKAILRNPEVSLPFKCLYLKMTAIFTGIETARELYNRLKLERPLTLEFFQQMIEIEKSHASNDVKYIRKCYNDATSELGKMSDEIWLNWISMELQHPQGRPTAIGDVYRKAMKTLDPIKWDQFILKFTIMTKSPE